ncbi:conserved Plasmodium protein, unknown function [Plasmodium knowlesi strain H]|uniref:Uncharacterized protein n=3 Tax=Plasmodium knowlesi TaxID=5850 RepID=A0A5K1VGC0_PLAKH|nr:ankyrin-repeat protein, putative [Plasmodium knowlesi strain H]OTN67667.1 Uncharacterized protein PKNOH_S05379000 [Plasmodium knowlesi]CAA9990380.1 ankyrin-repeat protein, putative [Plasmodium knowlesi strain H]SBO19586.1 conserved Plasmodium protein, unknown function [Plasmodium knowlesi strain H]SBO22655.1 conserved Plasmodium protein, unknown function [Plasmodium knowlesi strain H]VVS79854.1 ankyrin-repeat protein, putative [Plasmodium knowlesi strain H]|eukprot:XP_002260780.1 hypothetical protein, conserved in Plasmodium species [Plasmodium knowlesi strain H]
MKLFLCRHRNGGSAEGDLRVQAPSLGIGRGGNQMKGCNIGWRGRSAKEDLLQMGGSNMIGEKGEGSDSSTGRNDPPIEEPNDRSVERSSWEATQSAPRQNPIERNRNFFAHFDCADTFQRRSNGVERYMEELRNPPFRSTCVHAIPPICFYQRERNNKSSCFTAGDRLISSPDLPAGGGKGPCIQTGGNVNVDTPHASVMNRVRNKVGRRKKGKKKLTCLNQFFLRHMRHSKCCTCPFVMKTNRKYRCIRRSGAMCICVGVSHSDHLTIGKDNQESEKASLRRDEDLAKKRRGILRGEHNKKRGSEQKVGLRVQWDDGKEAYFFQDGLSEVDRGEAYHGNSDGTSECAQFHMYDREEEKKAKEEFTPGEYSPQWNSARCEEETMEKACETHFGRGRAPCQNDIGGDCTCNEVGAYMDAFRETLENPTLVDGITDFHPIHLATKEGNMELVKRMIKSGAYINSKTKRRKFTPLHLSASKGDLDSVKFLIENHADVNALSCDNETPLWCASISNHLEVCKYILTHGALPNLTIAKKKHDSPLHAASMMGNFEVVKLLIEYGADVSCLDSNLLEPVHYASFEGHKGIVKYLLFQQIKDAVDTKMKEVVNAMHKYGVYSKTLEQFYLLKYKAFYKKRFTSKILCCAIVSGKEKIVNLILRRGANPNYFDVRLQLFPIHAASITGNIRILKSLVRRGANIYAKTGCNNLAIDLTEDLEIKQYILQESRKINLRNAWLVRQRKSSHVLSRLSPDAFYYVCTFL